VFKALFAPPVISGQDHLRVRPASVWVIREFRTQLQVVIYFAIKDNPSSTIIAAHGIPASRRKIDDAQPIVAEPGRRRLIYIDTFVVGTTVVLRNNHRP
jgi:hypothetical protein